MTSASKSEGIITFVAMEPADLEADKSNLIAIRPQSIAWVRLDEGTEDNAMYLLIGQMGGGHLSIGPMTRLHARGAYGSILSALGTGTTITVPAGTGAAFKEGR